MCNVTYRHSGFEVERTHHQNAICANFSRGFAKVARQLSRYKNTTKFKLLLDISYSLIIIVLF